MSRATSSRRSSTASGSSSVINDRPASSSWRRRPTSTCGTLTNVETGEPARGTDPTTARGGPGADLVDVAVTPLAPERFRDVLSAESLASFERTITRGRELLDGRTLWTVNSTARGGGVAEMLRSLVGYVRGAGLDIRWVVIPGEPDFFRVTKRLHNRLHGADDGEPLGDAEREVYERVTHAGAELLARRIGPDDVVLLHDPQTAGMVP